ncbi:MAG: hypothetical protein WD708_01350 [Kiritimatiellia bacterium]
MRWFLIVLMLSAGLQAQEAEPEPFARAHIQKFLREAREAYAADDPEALLEAAQRFQALLDQAPEGELNPGALNLAKGMALLKAGKPEEALQAFEAITGFEDPEERSRLRNLKGNAQMQIGQAAAAAQEWDQAKSSLEAAVDSFTNALREMPTEEAARHNLELAQKRLTEIIEQMPPPQEDQEDQEKEDKEEQKDEQDQPDQSDQSDQPDQTDQTDQSDQSDQSDQTDQTDQPDQPDQPDPSEASPSTPEEFDAQQARQILDAYLEQEKHQRSQILQQRLQSIPVEKDW